MRYWEDMQSKWGFSDGNAIPDGIEAYRTVYVQTVNRLAEQLGSTVRAVAYDRPGVHNWCLLLFHVLNDLEGYSVENYVHSVDIHADEAELEEAMHEAIRQAYLLDVDRFVIVSVEIKEAEWRAFLENLKPALDEEFDKNGDGEI